MSTLARNWACRELGLGVAILLGWFVLSAEQVFGVLLCLLVGVGVNALLSRVVDHRAGDEDQNE